MIEDVYANLQNKQISGSIKVMQGNNQQLLLEKENSTNQKSLQIQARVGIFVPFKEHFLIQ